MSRLKISFYDCKTIAYFIAFYITLTFLVAKLISCCKTPSSSGSELDTACYLCFFFFPWEIWLFHCPLQILFKVLWDRHYSFYFTEKTLRIRNSVEVAWVTRPLTIGLSLLNFQESKHDCHFRHLYLSFHFEVSIILKGTCLYLYKNISLIAINYMSGY